ncbi:hypothetical protein MRX96_032859 [Rhipicephalus microplus]
MKTSSESRVHYCHNIFKQLDGLSLRLLAPLLLTVLPFLPARNLFVTVGLVVVERVFYIPSIDVTLLVSERLFRLHTQCSKALRLCPAAFCFMLVLLFAAGTWDRNGTWVSGEALCETLAVATDPQVIDNLAVFCVNAGCLDDARQLYEEINRLFQEHLESKVHLAAPRLEAAIVRCSSSTECCQEFPAADPDRSGWNPTLQVPDSASVFDLKIPPPDLRPEIRPSRSSSEDIEALNPIVLDTTEPYQTTIMLSHADTRLPRNVSFEKAQIPSYAEATAIENLPRTSPPAVSSQHTMFAHDSSPEATGSTTSGSSAVNTPYAQMLGMLDAGDAALFSSFDARTPEVLAFKQSMLAELNSLDRVVPARCAGFLFSDRSPSTMASGMMTAQGRDAPATGSVVTLSLLKA